MSAQRSSSRDGSKKDERRKAGARVPIRVEASLDLGGTLVQGLASDIGLGGVFFETQASIEPGTSGKLTRVGGEAPVQVRVSWVRRTPTPGVGLEFESARKT